jgi:predicted MFS family arabinose efflux permease
MVLPFLTLYLTGPRGFSAERAALAFAVWGLGSLVGTYAGGWLTDRLGSLRVQVASLVASGLSLLVLAQLRRPTVLLAGLFVVALLTDAFRPANSVAYAERASAAERSQAYAVRRLAINLGMTVGPAVGGFLARVDYAWLFVADGATCLAAAVLFVAVFARRHDSRRGVAEAARRPPPPSPLGDRLYVLFLLASTALGAVMFQFLTTFPLAMRDSYHLTEDRIGLLFAVNTVLIIVFEMVLTRRLRHVAPLRVVAWGALAVGLGYGMVPLGSTFAFAALAMAVLTWGEMLAFPQAEAWAASRADAANRGSYLGLYGLSFAAALTFGPAVGTWVYGRLGHGVTWAGCAVAGVVLWAAFTLLARRPDAALDAGGGESGT